MQLLLMLDAARGASAARITAVIPHYAYARSDKKDALHPIAARLRRLLGPRARTGADDDPALGAGAWIFSARRSHERAQGAGRNTSNGVRFKNTVVARRTWGMRSRRRTLPACRLPVAAGSKRRLSDDRVVLDAIVGDVDGKNVIVLDDEIANGGTIIEVLQKLRERGVKRMGVACTHGLFTGRAIERLRAQTDVDEIVTTDTVPFSKDKRLPNMTILSIAPLLAEAIRSIHLGRSVSRLFDVTDRRLLEDHRSSIQRWAVERVEAEAQPARRRPRCPARCSRASSRGEMSQCRPGGDHGHHASAHAALRRHAHAIRPLPE